MVTMKTTGIVRKIDGLGRIVIPIELRRALGIEIDDTMEISAQEDQIILKKYRTEKTCMITGEESDDNISLADGKIVLKPEIAQQHIKDIQHQLDKPSKSKISTAYRKQEKRRSCFLYYFTLFPEKA